MSTGTVSGVQNSLAPDSVRCLRHDIALDGEI